MKHNVSVIGIDDPCLGEETRLAFISQLENFFPFLPNTLRKMLIQSIQAHFLPASGARPDPSDNGAGTASEESEQASPVLLSDGPVKKCSAAGSSMPGVCASGDSTSAGSISGHSKSGRFVPDTCTPDISTADVSIKRLPDGTAYRLSITKQGASIVATAFGVELRDAYLFCMANGLWPLRFIRNAGALTLQEQEYLLRCRVAIVGCGALGGYASMLLARVGIGSMVLCDDDCFEESNLNRQLFCTEQTLGRSKAEAAREKLLQTASHMLITAFQERATLDTLPYMLAGSHALVDCVDSVAVRLVLEEAASQMKIPYIHGAVAGFEGFAGVSFVECASSGLMRGLYGQDNVTANDKSVIAEAGLFAPVPSAIGTLEALFTVQTLLSAFHGHEIALRKLVYLDLTCPTLEALTL